MTIIVGFCASRANTGKTTLLLRVLAELRRRGLKVAVLKHGRHLDEEGEEEKDSSRYAAAGAEACLFMSPQGWQLEARPAEEPSLQQAVSLLQGYSPCQVLLVEGYKQAAIPKIALCRAAVSLDLPCPASQLSALVCDVPLDTDLPCFDFSQVGELCDFILALPPA